MYDSAGNFEKGTLSVVQVKNGLYLLTVGASVEFLTDENTVYPVYIDPTLTIDSGTNYIEDTTIYAGKPAINYGTDTKLVVGTGSPSYGVGRAVVRIPGIYESVALEDMMPANILSATFTVRPYSSPAASQTLYLHPLEDYTWTESGATWNSITAGGYSNSAWSSATVGTSVATFNITSLAKEWPYGAYYPDSGFLIKLADSAEGSNCKRLYTTEHTTASYRPYATFTYLEDGVYRIKNMNSSLYMEVAGGKSKDHNGVIQSGMLSANPDRLSQLWKVKALSDGTFSIRPMHDPMMGLSIYNNTVQINGIGDRDNETIITETAQSGVAALWSITQASVSGGLSIRPDGNTTKALRVSGDSLADGALIVQGNYDNYYFDSWLFEEVTDVTPGVLLYDTTTGIRLNDTSERTLIKDTTATLEDYNIKAVYYSPTSITQNFSYSSGNSTILTVNSYGLINGIKDGVASVSVSSGGYSKSFSLRVLPFANGVYFIENKEYPGYYVQGDDDYSDENLTGEILELREFSGASRQQWTLTHIGGGYYKLATVGGVLSVNAEYLHEEDEALIIDSDLGLDRQKWKITQTVNGSFKIKAKSSESYTTTDLAMVCGTRAVGVTNGVDVEQREFMGENDSYKDEWCFENKNIITIMHYYDQGFLARDARALEILHAAQYNVSQRLKKLFGIDLIVSYTPYTSLSDECKIAQFGVVEYANLDSLCTHENSNCNKRSCMREALHEDVGSNGSDTLCYALWTGHRSYMDYSSNYNDGTHSIVIVPKYASPQTPGAQTYYELAFDEKVKKYTQTLMHEFSHHLTLSDHYCKKTENDENGENITKCGGKACYTCVFGYENEEDMPKCVMLASDYAYNDLSEIYCNYCIEIIKDHLGFVE